MTDAIVSEEFYDEFWWDDYGSEAPTAATVRYWRYTTAGGKEYLQAGLTFAAGVHDFTATSLGSGGFSFTLASLPTGFQGRRIHREARATGPLASYPVQPWDGYATANDEDDNQTLIQAETDAIDADLALIKDNNVGDFDGSTDSLRALRDENKAEHDTTQSKVDQIGAAAEARLTGPSTFEIPDSGSSTFVLRFVLRDLDQSPSALVDPDSNQVDVTVIDQSGSAPTGVTLAGTPAGRMTRDSAGRYSLVVTVDSTAVDETQLRFTADYAYLSTSNVALHDVILGDFDQLDRIESNTDTLLTRVGTPSDAIDDPTLFGQHFDTQDDIAALNDPTAAAVADAVWDEPKAGHVAAGSMGEEVQSHATPDEVNAQADIALADYDAPTKAEMDAFEARMQAEHDATQGELANGDYGLDALDGHLEDILSRLGSFTAVENLKAILGDLSTTKRLGQVLGAFSEAATLTLHLDQMRETADGGFDRETDSLEALRDRIDAIDAATNPTTIADAVWDESAADHVAAGSFGEEVQSHATPTEVKAQADAALTDYDPPTRTEATADKDEVKTHVSTEVDEAQGVIQAHRDEVEPELDELVAEVGDEADASTAPTVFGRLKRGEENVDAEHATTRTLVTDETDAIDSAIADVDSDVASLRAEIDNGTYGLAALNADLDTILSRLGLTTDTGGTTTTGTAQAKLNAILALAIEIEDEVIGPDEKTEPAYED